MASFDDVLAEYYDQFINFREAIDLLAWSENKPTSEVARGLKEMGFHKNAVYVDSVNGGYAKDDKGLLLALLDNAISGSGNSFVFEGATDFFADEQTSGWLRQELAATLQNAGIDCLGDLDNSLRIVDCPAPTATQDQQSGESEGIQQKLNAFAADLRAATGRWPSHNEAAQKYAAKNGMNHGTLRARTRKQWDT